MNIIKKVGVVAEFAKIICISVGYLFTDKGESHFRIKSFYGNDDEKIYPILTLF
jgi:hypothetical protein